MKSYLLWESQLFQSIENKKKTTTRKLNEDQ